MRFSSIMMNRSSIAARLAMWFLLIALAPCMVLLSLTLHFSNESLEASVKQRLMLICDSKAAMLESYIAERRIKTRSTLVVRNWWSCASAPTANVRCVA